MLAAGGAGLALALTRTVRAATGPRARYGPVGFATAPRSQAWEQATARRVLLTEPVIIPGSRHANVVTEYAPQVADAAVRGL
jgi:hypothetical protein